MDENQEEKLRMLRSYQRDICNRVLKAFQRVRSVMVQMPTGTGKTWVLAALVEQLLDRTEDKEAAVIIATHRRQLVKQIEETLQRMCLREEGRMTRYLNRVKVCSIQWLTLNRKKVTREPALVVIDEAHHALAATYRGLWKRWPKAHFLGLTATPYRMDGKGFTDLFDTLVASDSIQHFMAEGWLAGYVYYSIRPDSPEQGLVDSLCLRGTDGDYLTREMREKLDAPPTLQRLYEAYRKLAGDRKGLVYAIDIAHAEHIAAYYRKRGLAAAAVSARTPLAQRREWLRKLENGSLRVLVNVDLFSEGFDCPDIACIQLARPTLSLSKYLQMVGRGLRRHAGKEQCVLIDQVGLYRVFGLPSADRDWELGFAGMERRGKDGRMLPANGKGLQGWFPPAMLEGTEEVVKIASFYGPEDRPAVGKGSGFEKVKRGRGYGWKDRCSGIVFRQYPQTVNVGGIQLATEDGLLFFPRIGSPWIDEKTGISRKALETQPYQGICWQRLYIPFDRPNRVFRLVEVKPNRMRVYEDEEGKGYVQENPDGRLRELTDAEELCRIMKRCDEEWARDKEEQQRKYLRKVMRPEEDFPKELATEGVTWEVADGELLRLRYGEQGIQKEEWIDRMTGYLHRQRPILFQRGCVSMLREGEQVYIRNIPHEAGMPYRNWEVRADERICCVGDALYFAWELDRPPYRIRKRSEDFRMFVLEDREPEEGYERRKGEIMVINQPDRPLEVKTRG